MTVTYKPDTTYILMVVKDGAQLLKWSTREIGRVLSVDSEAVLLNK